MAARKTRRSIRILPGLSRSTACTKTKSCARLDGHKGSHRASLTAVTKSPVARKTPAVVTEGGVEVHSADRYTTVEPKAPGKVPAKASKARKASPRKTPAFVSVEVVTIAGSDFVAKVAKDGTITLLPVRITQVPAEAAERKVADTANGRHRLARRAAVAPKGRNDVTIAESLR